MGFRVQSVLSSKDHPQQRLYRSHLLDLLPRVKPARVDGVVRQLLCVAEAAWQTALLDGIEKIVDIDMDGV